MLNVEELYQQAIDNLTPGAKLQRAFGFFEEIYQMLRHQLLVEKPNLDERATRIEIASRLYLTDAPTLKLLDRARRDG